MKNFYFGVDDYVFPSLKVSDPIQYRERLWYFSSVLMILFFIIIFLFFASTLSMIYLMLIIKNLIIIKHFYFGSGKSQHCESYRNVCVKCVRRISSLTIQGNSTKLDGSIPLICRHSFQTLSKTNITIFNFTRIVIHRVKINNNATIL